MVVCLVSEYTMVQNVKFGTAHCKILQLKHSSTKKKNTNDCKPFRPRNKDHLLVLGLSVTFYGLFRENTKYLIAHAFKEKELRMRILGKLIAASSKLLLKISWILEEINHHLSHQGRM